MAKKKSKTTIDDALEALQEDLNKTFKDGSVSLLSEPGALSKVDFWVSTRSIVVDSVLRGDRPFGSSLVPFGRQMEISGPENSGKTTLCAQIAAETQARGGIVVVVDTEERVADDYWTKLGVDLHRVLRIRSTDLKDVFTKQYRAMQKAWEIAPDCPVLLIWDSLGGTAGAEMIDVKSNKDIMDEAQKFGMRRAKLISDGMEAINTIVSKTKTCYLYTNHVYLDINEKRYPKYLTRGGQKPRYFATVRLQLKPVGHVEEPDPEGYKGVKEVGLRIRVEALKNSMCGVLMKRDAVVVAGRGFANEYTVFEVAKQRGIIEVAQNGFGRWLSPDGEELKWRGYSDFEENIVPHPAFADLTSQVVEIL